MWTKSQIKALKQIEELIIKHKLSGLDIDAYATIQFYKNDDMLAIADAEDASNEAKEVYVVNAEYDCDEFAQIVHDNWDVK